MSHPSARLKKVDYARGFKAERELEIQLVGASQWIRDIELLLEEDWKGVRCFSGPAEAYTALGNSGVRLALIELKPHGEDTARWIEGCLQNKIASLLISPDSVNHFEWSAACKKAAAHNIGGVLFASESRIAAQELTDFLDTSNILDPMKWLDDVSYIRAANQGYSLLSANENHLTKEIFSVLSEDFIIDSDSLARALILLESFELWKQPKTTGSELFSAFMRIERELAETDVQRLIDLSVNSYKAGQTGVLSEDYWSSEIERCQFGILSRRRLQKKFKEVSLLIKGSTQTRTLKIA